ncbi:MAG TPA: histidine kinase [Anaerolineales bacterium]|nr:histidine kinase [Anaerolineales bacterium]
MQKNSRLTWRSLIPQIFAIFILPLTGFLLLVSFGGLYIHQQAMRTLVGERDERAARAAASALSEQIRHLANSIEGLALRAEAAGPNRDLQQLLANSTSLLADFDGGLAFLSPQGEVLASTSDPVFWQSLDAPYLGSSNPPTGFVSLLHPQTGVPMLVTITLTPSSGVVAAGAFSPSAPIRRVLSGLYSSVEGTEAFVVDANRRLLYRQGNLYQSIDLAQHSGVDEALRGESGASYIQVGREEHVVAYSPVLPLGWALVIEESWEHVTTPLLRTTENAPLVLIPVLLLAFLALWYITRWIVQPLQSLESRAAELGWGDFEAIERPVGGIAEIRRLQAELIHLAHKVQAAQKGLRGYIGAITAGQEEERRRLARELHDDTLQALIALNQRIQLVNLSIAGHPQGEVMADSIAEIQSLTEQTIQNLRRVTRALRPVYLEELGLVAALDMLARETDQSNNLTVTFRRSGEEQRLSPTVELAFYRIAQEALSNTLRHAQASRADLRLGFTPQATILEVRDDGRGFVVPESPAEFAPSGHFGLLGLHERADLIGARLEIHSAPGRGTRVSVTYTNH